MHPRATQHDTQKRNAEHACRPGWRQAADPGGPAKPILVPPTRVSSPPGTVWLCSCDRVWVAYLRLTEMAEPDGPVRWRRERPWERLRRHRAARRGVAEN